MSKARNLLLALTIFALGTVGVAQTPTPEPTSVPGAGLVSPVGEVHTVNPVFAWSSMSGATSYQLWVTGEAGVVHDTEHTPASVCGSDAVCQVVLPGDLSEGMYLWGVRAYDGTSWGEWQSDTFEVWPRYFQTVGDGSEPYRAQFILQVLAIFGVSMMLIRLLVKEQSFLLWTLFCTGVAMATGGVETASHVYLFWLVTCLIFMVVRALYSPFGTARF